MDLKYSVKILKTDFWMKMKNKNPIYIKELKNYTKRDLLEFISDNDLDKLLKYAIINKDKGTYQFNYVGIIIIDDLVINCYPKYFPKKDEDSFKQVIKVIKKYNNLYEEIDYSNDELEDISFNLLSMMVFFLEDYYQYGLYSNTQNILEINGNGEIDWDRTINYTDPIIKNNQPYYVELHTKYKINDIFDYFRLLHEYIITKCSKKLEDIGLLDLFDLTPVELSDKEQDDFGELKVILNNLEKELNVEFNTHKQKLLKSMHTFLKEENSFSNENYLTVFGTSTYHVIWEDVCRRVLNDKLDSTIMNAIKKPKWILKSGKEHPAPKSFEPDIITWNEDTFIILDAKYYNLTFNEDVLEGQPGLTDITKQYLYQLALEDYRIKNNFQNVKNALLFPKYTGEIDNKGYVEIEILKNLNLENIQVIMLPADEMNQRYLDNKKINIKHLNL